MSPSGPTGSLGVFALVLGCCFPTCCRSSTRLPCSPLLLPCGAAAPGSGAGAPALSASLCVLPVVLPYGRLRHAVLPQGRTTDRMLGLPLRPRTPISLHSRGSRARMVPIQRCFELGMELPGGACVGRLGAGVHSSMCVYVYNSLGGTERCGVCQDLQFSKWGPWQTGMFVAGISRSTSQTKHSTPGVEEALSKSH